jgi:ZIP family zinc transporter
MALWMQAGLWGTLAGAALLLGAGVGYAVRLPPRVIAGVMAFGSGVLISALSFDLMEEAYQEAGFVPAAIGFFAGALIYSGANGLLARLGAKHRKRSNPEASAGDDAGGGGAAIAVGALIDGIPESMAIGLTLLAGGGVSVPTVIAIFISNIPEGLSSSAGMRASGRSAGFVFGLWTAIALASGAAAVVGYSVFGQFSVETQAATTAVAAGGILSMLVETMIPEAFEGTHNWAGLITCAGFACAFALSMAEG